jgi:hypothetical protein
MGDLRKDCDVAAGTVDDDCGPAVVDGDLGDHVAHQSPMKRSTRVDDEDSTRSMFVSEDRSQQRVVLEIFDGRDGTKKGMNESVLAQLKITGLESRRIGHRGQLWRGPRADAVSVMVLTFPERSVCSTRWSVEGVRSRCRLQWRELQR